MNYQMKLLVLSGQGLWMMMGMLMIPHRLLPTGETASAEGRFVLWGICGGREIGCFLLGSLGISWDFPIWI